MINQTGPYSFIEGTDRVVHVIVGWGGGGGWGEEGGCPHFLLPILFTPGSYWVLTCFDILPVKTSLYTKNWCEFTKIKKSDKNAIPVAPYLVIVNFL